MQYTENYNFRKPEDGEASDNVDLNFNADAIDTELKAVNDKADEANEKIDSIADYIVEQGTRGDFFYRKWNSGYAEVDYKKTFSNIPINSPSGNIYYGTIDTSAAFPFAFIEKPCVSLSAGCSTNAWVWLSNVVTVTNFPTCYIARGTPTTTTIVDFSAHITGRWK